MYPVYNYPMFTPYSTLKLTCPMHYVNRSNYNDNDIVITSNVTSSKMSKETYRLLDSGTTDHFLAINSHIKIEDQQKPTSKSKSQTEIICLL